jgi:hypothetical protein
MRQHWQLARSSGDLERGGLPGFESRPTNQYCSIGRCVNVIALTVFISLALALLFVAMFIGDRVTARSGSLEQDSLLPLDGDDLGAAPEEDANRSANRPANRDATNHYAD